MLVIICSFPELSLESSYQISYILLPTNSSLISQSEILNLKVVFNLRTKNVPGLKSQQLILLTDQDSAKVIKDNRYTIFNGLKQGTI